jgi:hypothetical protein
MGEESGITPPAPKEVGGVHGAQTMRKKSFIVHKDVNGEE